MDLIERSEDKEFRARARAWLEKNVPKAPRPVDDREGFEFDLAWQRIQYEGGWAGTNWPKDYGGLGFTDIQSMIWLEECTRANAPPFMSWTYVGLGHAGPTLIALGTDAQKAFHLPKILKGELSWCQGFSEPGAGSDLANLRTKGEIDGDHLVVNGQKTWTTGGQFATYQELLVRTDPQSQRHKGLTWIICDMRLPGIEVRPIKTMMGEYEVNDVFYNDVRIPLSNVVGKMGEGWSAAMTTFSFERGISFLADQMAILDRIEQVIAMARKTYLPNGKLAIDDDEIAHKLAQLKAETIGVRAMFLSSISLAQRTGVAGSESSLIKLALTAANKKLYEVVGDILGPSFLDYGEERSSNPWAYQYMWSWVLTIAGGSSEIQREIVADRILNLPKAR